MRRALILICLLLAPPAQAKSNEEAREAFLTCYAKNADKLIPELCHSIDTLNELANRACQMEAAWVGATTAVGDPRAAVRSLQIDGQLGMLQRVSAYNKAGNCKR